MKRVWMLLVCLLVLVCGFAQHQLKPCGTAVLRRHQQPTALHARALTRGADVTRTFVGEKRGLVILVSFPNQPFRDEKVLQQWRDIICTEGYHDNGAPGSVSDYFYDQSYGQFRICFDVVGPVEMSQPYQYYGTNKHWEEFDDEFDQNDGQMVEEACRAVSDSVNFADYDWDGDGFVDMIYILYAGHGEADYWKKDEDVIWPHMAELSFEWYENYPNGLTLQGLTIDTYACSNELSDIDNLAGLGSICHEFSHCLDLPDLYNTLTGWSIVGSYDLMDQGNYNLEGWCPPGYSSYERYACGWLSPEAVDDPQSIVALTPLHQEPDVRIFRLEPDANDYYLIEQRAKDSWDRSLPSHGLMAWHIDYDATAWEENTVNADGKRVERLSVRYIPTALDDLPTVPGATLVAVFDLQGRRLSPASLSRKRGGVCVAHYSDGSIKKVFY